MTFSSTSFWKVVSKEFIKWIMPDKYLVPPSKNNIFSKITCLFIYLQCCSFQNTFIINWWQLSMTSIMKNSPVKKWWWRSTLQNWHNQQLSSQAAIPLILNHHGISWFTHKEKSSFNIIQNFCKGNTKHGGIL